MNYFTGTASYGSTGVKTVTVGFQPVGMRITLGARFGTTEVSPRESIGWSDGTSQFYHARYDDSTGRQQKAGNDRIVSQWERVSGTLTEVVRANFDSFTTTDVKFNVITANANYQFYIEAWS